MKATRFLLSGSGCFNRYIVECKCGNLINMALDKFGFNRYIVECKYFLYNYQLLFLYVLIDT